MTNRLLGIEQLDPDTFELGLARPVPPWVFAILAAAALALALWSYAKLDGPAWTRATLATLRALTLTLLLVLVMGPQAVERQTLVEPDHVVILIDRSASLTIADTSPTSADSPSADSPTTPTAPPAETLAPADPATQAPRADPADRITRDAALRATLSAAAPALARMAEKRSVTYLGFGERVRDLPPTDAGPPELAAPADRRTDIAQALTEAASRVAGRPVAGLVVISDGRWTSAATDAALDNATARLDAAGAPIWAVPLGSPEPLADLAVRAVRAPDLAFTGDQTPVTVEIQRLGPASNEPVRVTLTDTETGQTLDQQTINLEQQANTTDPDPIANNTQPNAPPNTPQAATVTLRAAAENPGTRTWRVTVEPLAPQPATARDLVPHNNTQTLSLDFTDRPIRVLFVDGYPRWEQRYLRNLLIREPSIDASTLILAPDRRFLQEGNTEIDRLPASPEAWAEYDLVILGDVRPDVFTPTQLRQLAEHIATNGAGLVWAAGPSAVPSRWHDSPLASLLPFAPGAADQAGFLSDTLASPTPAAERLGVLRLAGPDNASPWPPELTDPSTGWSRLRYTQRISTSALKPAAITLANATTVDNTAPPGPLVLTMRFGAGNSIYIATDETWRWRYGRGELLFERFWLGLLRLLGRERLAQSGAPAELNAAPDQAAVTQPVRVTLHIRDQSLLNSPPPTVAVNIQRAGATQDPDTAADLAPDERLTLRALNTNPADTTDNAIAAGVTYAALWQPTAPGRWTLRADTPELAPLALETTVTARWPTDELATPQTDHPALAALTQTTEQGGLLPLNQLDTLDQVLPNREARRQFERTEPLWDAPIALIALVTLLAIEWIGRRLIRLI